MICRSCGQDGLLSVLSLGKTPLANRLLSYDQLMSPEPEYPLDLVFCPGCSLIQITETVPPEILFSEYLYFSSFAETVINNARRIVQRLIQSCKLDADNLVVEIASNDGYLLQFYHQAGIPVLGIEPAANIARVAQEERGIRTLCEFFDKDLATRIKDQGLQADVIHANNVLAHVADLNGFAAGIDLLLKDEGIAVIEVPYVRDMIDHVEFDTIYHEHLCYYSLTSLEHLFRAHGLMAVDVERIPIHGGSLRVFARHAALFEGQQSDRTRILLEEEQVWGVGEITFYRDFGQRVEELRHKLTGLLVDMKSQGKRLAAYGASAKGSTLLNCFGIDAGMLDFVADRSTFKQGLYTPGTHLPILPPEALLEKMPDAVLLLTWNFADEILEQQREFRARGGRFIIPIPTLKVI
ncbi:MAG: class I SAM-dependent methyltransferase [Anaerolineales bacterium]|nr:class I SAM-dependent methyltransferase [Anaerolineales bacterium]